MRLKHILTLQVALTAGLLYGIAPGKTIDMPVEQLRDKIRGGLLGQILGNLNGLPHEMKYIDEPGNVTSYTPTLPEGARIFAKAADIAA